MSGQLSLFGTAPDQQTYQSTLWGTLTFYPTKGDGWNDTCKHCLLWAHPESHKQECQSAPCRHYDRADGKNGYYSIHQMPKERKIR